MRISAETAPTSWGTYLRQKRLQTKVVRPKWRCLRPMCQRAFAEWLAAQAGLGFSWRAYIEWERGVYLPDQHVQQRICDALAVANLPGAGAE